MLKAKSLDEPKIGKLATRNIHELLKLTTWSHTSVLHIETLVLFSHWKCSKNTGQRVWGKSRLYIQDILYCPSHKKWMTASNLHSSFVELPSAQCSGKNHFPSPPKKISAAELPSKNPAWVVEVKTIIANWKSPIPSYLQNFHKYVVISLTHLYKFSPILKSNDSTQHILYRVSQKGWVVDALRDRFARTRQG